MGLKSIKILGISVTTDSKKNILEYIDKYFIGNSKFNPPAGGQNSKFGTEPLVIVTPNPEQIVLAQKDKHFADILNQADVALPDGIGLVASMRLLNLKFQISNFNLKIKRVPGVEFMEALVTIASEQGYRVGLIGGKGGVAVQALECLQARYPGLKGWAEDGPKVQLVRQETRDKGQVREDLVSCHLSHITSPEKENDYYLQLAKRIVDDNTRMFFVGLGAPKQEYFIEKLQKICLMSPVSCHPFIIMSVGGSFDMLTSRVRRAPFAVRALGLEWLWRLIREPWRWRRQLTLLKFLWLVIREKLSQGQSP